MKKKGESEEHATPTVNRSQRRSLPLYGGLLILLSFFLFFIFSSLFFLSSKSPWTVLLVQIFSLSKRTCKLFFCFLILLSVSFSFSYLVCGSLKSSKDHESFSGESGLFTVLLVSSESTGMLPNRKGNYNS